MKTKLATFNLTQEYIEELLGFALQHAMPGPGYHPEHRVEFHYKFVGGDGGLRVKVTAWRIDSPGPGHLGPHGVLTPMPQMVPTLTPEDIEKTFAHVYDDDHVEPPERKYEQTCRLCKDEVVATFPVPPEWICSGCRAEQERRARD